MTFRVSAAAGAGGVFLASGSSSVTVGSDASGTATAPTFTANDTAGSYTILAASAYGSVLFSLTNAAAGASSACGAALADLAGSPTTITAGVGATQAIRVGRRFRIRLAVTVTDSEKRPVPGALVMFAAPTRGPSGRFACRSRRSRTSRVKVRTDACGVAAGAGVHRERRRGRLHRRGEHRARRAGGVRARQRGGSRAARRAPLAPRRLRPRDLARVASVGLRTRPLRAGLSALGIAIGVAAIVAVLGLSSSSQAGLLSQIDRLGTNLLTVTNGQRPHGQDGRAAARRAVDDRAHRTRHERGRDGEGQRRACSARPLVPAIDTNALSVQAASVESAGDARRERRSKGAT